MKGFWSPLVLEPLTGTPSTDPSGRQPTVDQRLDRPKPKVDDLYRRFDLSPEAPAKVADFNLLFRRPKSAGTFLRKQHYAICHRDEWKIPEWVTYRLSAENGEGVAKRTNDFRSNPVILEGQQAELADSMNSSYCLGRTTPEASSVARSCMNNSKTRGVGVVSPTWYRNLFGEGWQ